MSVVAYPHIEIDASGEPTIAGANTKVAIVAMDRLAYHWDADEIQRQRPHLSLGQIYSALAYYYDHEVEINQSIADRIRREDVALSKLGESRVKAKLELKKGAR